MRITPHLLCLLGGMALAGGCRFGFRPVGGSSGDLEAGGGDATAEDVARCEGPADCTTTRFCDDGHCGHAPSCAALLQNGNGTDGRYLIDPTGGDSGDALAVYCEMTAAGGGWMLVADVDAATGDCPGEWSYSANPQCCVPDVPQGGCKSAFFTTHGVSYREVLGEARGYQQGSTDGFHTALGPDGPYIDGLSITHGAEPRRHIWSFVSGYSKHAEPVYLPGNCPCAETPGNDAQPFVGEHYSCESGNADETAEYGVWHVQDPLFDGQGCPAASSCCDAPTPWFQRELPATSTAPLEARLCLDEGPGNESFGIYRLTLYVR